jgi:hypothetical protein
MPELRENHEPSLDMRLEVGRLEPPRVIDALKKIRMEIVQFKPRKKIRQGRTI